MAGQMSTSSQEHAAEEGKLRAKLREVTEALKKEKEASKKLQKQVCGGTTFDFQTNCTQKIVDLLGAKIFVSSSFQSNQINTLHLFHLFAFNPPTF